MKYTQVAFFAVAVLLLAVVPSCNKKLSKDDTVKIGAVLLLTGDNSLWGQNAKKAMELLREEINATGGVDGKQIEIVYEDSQGEAKVAVSAFRKLTGLDAVPVVLGDMLSSTTLAMAPLANQEETVLIGISCSSPAVTDAGEYVYRVWPSDLYEGKVFAKYVIDQQIKRVALVYLNNDYGTGLKDAFREEFETLGGQIVTEEAYTDAHKEFRSIAAKVKNANPDAVYIVGYYEDTALVIRDLRQSGVSAKLLGTSSAIHEKLIDIAGSASDGFTAAVVNDFNAEALTERQTEFVEKYKAKYGEEPDWAATHGADAFLVAVECLRNSDDGRKIKAYIDKQRSFSGINQGVTFNAAGDVVDKPIAVQKVLDGRFETVWSQ